MAEPRPIGEPVDLWIDYEHPNPKTGEPTYTRVPPSDISDWRGAKRPANAVHIKRYTYEDGSIIDYTDDGVPTYIDTIPELAKQWAAKSGAGRIATPGALDPADKYYSVWNPDTGEYEKKDNPNYDPDLAAKKQELLDAQIAAQNRSGIPRATPYRPGEEEGVQLRNEGERLANLKAQQQLQSPWVVAQQQLWEGIEAIAKDPRFDPAEATRQSDLLFENYRAMLEGTTPFAKSEAKLKREDEQRKQQQNLAQNFVSDRLQVGSNMAQGLLGGLTNAFKGVYSRVKPSYNYNVFDLANAYMDQNQGAELNDLARAVLSGALRNKEQV